MKIVHDQYGSVVVKDISPSESSDFILRKIEENTLDNSRIVWVYITKENINILSSLLKNKFYFHSCKKNEILLIRSDFSAPGEATFFMSVGGILIKNNKLLVVKEKSEKRDDFFKLPRGFMKFNESISDGVAREFKEETNINVKFESIVSIGQFQTNMMNRNCMYYVCKNLLIIYLDARLYPFYRRFKDESNSLLK
ncbi:MAG: NUDIX domain-containing protein [bacterium]